MFFPFQPFSPVSGFLASDEENARRYSMDKIPVTFEKYLNMVRKIWSCPGWFNLPITNMAISFMLFHLGFQSSM